MNLEDLSERKKASNELLSHYNPVVQPRTSQHWLHGFCFLVSKLLFKKKSEKCAVGQWLNDILWMLMVVILGCHSVPSHVPTVDLQVATGLDRILLTLQNDNVSFLSQLKGMRIVQLSIKYIQATKAMIILTPAWATDEKYCCAITTGAKLWAY